MINAGTDPLPDLIVRGRGRLHDNWNIAIARVGLYRIQDFHAVEPRHHAVEKDRLDAFHLGEQLQRGVSVIGLDGLIAGLGEIFDEDVSVKGIVIDNEDFRSHFKARKRIRSARRNHSLAVHKP